MKDNKQSENKANIDKLHQIIDEFKNDPKNASKYTFPVGLEDDLKIEEKGKKA